MTVSTATSLEELLQLSKEQKEKVFILNFWTQWAEACIHMNEVFSALAINSDPTRTSFWDVDAEVIGDVSLHFGVTAVPTFILVRNGTELLRIEEANPQSLEAAIKEYTIDMNAKLVSLINRHPFMVFIKGTPAAPRCGFTRQLIDLLSQHAIQFDYYDILQDEPVRQALKTFSDWPTYPQIYIRGELLGGLDIFKETVASGQLKELVQS